MIGDIFTSIKRRTKRAYLQLFDQPEYLFGRGTKTIIFPNGEREIWIKNSDGTKGFCVRASDGAAGFSIRIRQFGQSDTLVSSDWMPSDRAFTMPPELECVSYYSDPYAQQFKKWYFSPIVDGKHAEPYPADLGLEPRQR